VKKEEFMDYLSSNEIKVFNIHDAAKIFGKPEKYVSMRLTSMPKIKRATRGVYYIYDADVSEIATKIVVPSYISLISAFALHNVTTQMPLEIHVIAPVQHRTLEVEGYKIRFIKFTQERIFGYSRINGSMVAILEKAIVDSLYLNLYTNEAMEVVMDNISLLDKAKLIDYGIRMRSKATISRLGYLMEMAGYDAGRLEELRSERYVRFSDTGTSKNMKWRVIYAE
jgi:predicted transcriptional regulator of viral defense system